MAPPMTNQTLGDRIGVSHSMASRIRNGHRLPSTRTLREIHREFGVPLDELMDAHTKGAAEFGILMRRTLKDPDATRT